MVIEPIVLITFNRPGLVKKQMDILRKVRPSKLYFISDGARRNVEGEEALVEEVRSLLDTVDWECAVEKIYASQNMGCDLRIVSGLNEVFSKEECAIILEDDCIPNLSFFRFCSEMLRRYCDRSDIMYISGSKESPGHKMTYSYGFSYNTGTWGWATWRRAWKEWHWDMDEWNANKYLWLKGIFSYRYRRGWIKDMERYFSRESIPWDYVWRFCVGARLSVFPAVNLIENMGFGEFATHTVEVEYGYIGQTYEMGEIIHPEEVKADLKYVRALEKQSRIPIIYRIINKLKRMTIGKIKQKRS